MPASPTAPVRLSITSSALEVATRHPFLDWQIDRSSPNAVIVVTPGYARLARQASAHPGLQSFATSWLSEPGFAWRRLALPKDDTDGNTHLLLPSAPAENSPAIRASVAPCQLAGMSPSFEVRTRRHRCRSNLPPARRLRRRAGGRLMDLRSRRDLTSKLVHP